MANLKTTETVEIEREQEVNSTELIKADEIIRGVAVLLNRREHLVYADNSQSYDNEDIMSFCGAVLDLKSKELNGMFK